MWAECNDGAWRFSAGNVRAEIKPVMGGLEYTIRIGTAIKVRRETTGDVAFAKRLVKDTLVSLGYGG